METTFLTDVELRRYKNQIDLPIIGENGQLLLKKSKVLVIGAGGLGTPVLQYIAAAGIGNIGICDTEYVNESNFYRQIMYGASDLGKLKTIVAKEKLSLLNPFTAFNIVNIFISSENVNNVLTEYDIIVDCTNSIDVSEILNEACCKLNKPLVWGAVNEFNGYLSVFQDYKFNWEEKKYSFIKNGAGAFGIISGIIGSLQASEVIKLLLQNGDTLIHKLLLFDGLKSDFRIEMI